MYTFIKEPVCDTVDDDECDDHNNDDNDDNRLRHFKTPHCVYAGGVITISMTCVWSGCVAE